MSDRQRYNWFWRTRRIRRWLGRELRSVLSVCRADGSENQSEEEDEDEDCANGTGGEIEESGNQQRG